MKKLAAALAIAGVIGFASYASAAQGDYVVVLKEPQIITNDSVTALTDRIYLAPSYDAAASVFPEENIESIFPDTSLEIPDSELDSEASEYAVLNEEVLPYPDSADDSLYYNQWYLSHIRAQSAWRNSLTGEGIKVGIIDTGINLSHVDLVSKTVNSFNCIPGADTGNVSDTFGHGTMVAGVIAAQTNNRYCISGITPEVELAVIKIMENSSSAPDISAVLTSISKAIEFECDVINISLGFTINNPDGDGYTAIRNEIARGVEKGIIFVASAGNVAPGEPGNVVYYPAAFDNVISVAGLGREKTDADPDDLPQAKYTSTSGDVVTILSDEPSTTTVHNSKVVCAAPGFKILSTFIGGLSKTAANNGTSFAAPMVASAAVIAKQLDPTINHTRFSEYLKSSLRDVYTEGYDEYTGYGALDIESLIKVIKDDIYKPTPSPAPITGFDAEVVKDGNKYTITALHDAAAEDFKVIAAAYCSDRLVTIKSQADSAESEGRRFSFTCDEAIDTVAVMVWTPDGVYPLTDCVKQKFATPEQAPEITTEPTEAEE